jgi:magnesium chelatase accessory protein
MGGAAGPPTLPGMARAIGELLGAERFQPAIIVGHSAGAALALELVTSGRVKPSLVVGLNAALTPYGGLLAPIAQPMAKLFASLSPVSSLIAARARQPDTVERLLGSTGSSLAADGVAGYRDLFSREEHVAATLAMMAYWDLGTLDRRLDDLPCPLCLVVGELDRAVPPSQASKTERRVPRGRVIRLAGLGHLAHEERPRQVAEAIEEAERWQEQGDA